MSEVLTTWPGRAHGKKGSWMDPFLDGRIHRLNGADIGTRTESSLRGGFHAMAEQRGKKLRFHVESHDPLVVVVQALDKA